MDADGDGEVCLEEYTGAQMRLIPSTSYESARIVLDDLVCRRGVGAHRSWPRVFDAAVADLVSRTMAPPSPPTPNNRSRAQVERLEELRRRANRAKNKLEQLFSRAFALCDVNRDGAVSRLECVSLDKQIARVTGAKYDPDSTSKCWVNMDSDGDGDVTLSEYVQAQMTPIPLDDCPDVAELLDGILDGVDELRRQMVAAKQTLLNLFRTAFALCDVDGDGAVSRSECARIDKHMARILKTEYDEKDTIVALARMDADGDGDVTVEEYVKGQMAPIHPDDYIDTAEFLTQVVGKLVEIHKEQQRFKKLLREVFAARFALCDINGDDDVSMGEFFRLEKQVCRVTDSVFNEADAAEQWRCDHNPCLSLYGVCYGILYGF
jgi:Ca2+-binding EF-hand superfamily protein